MEELDLTQLWKELWGNKSPQKVVEGSEKRCSLEVWTLVDKSELAGGPGNQSHPQVGVRPQRGWCRNPRKVVALRSCHLLNSQGSFWRWIGSLCDSWPSGSRGGCSVRRSARASWNLADSASISHPSEASVVLLLTASHTSPSFFFGNSNLEPYREDNSGKNGPQCYQVDSRAIQRNGEMFMSAEYDL